MSTSSQDTKYSHLSFNRRRQRASSKLPINVIKTSVIYLLWVTLYTLCVKPSIVSVSKTKTAFLKTGRFFLYKNFHRDLLKDLGPYSIHILKTSFWLYHNFIFPSTDLDGKAHLPTGSYIIIFYDFIFWFKRTILLNLL
jgi:hypothetical protein